MKRRSDIQTAAIFRNPNDQLNPSRSIYHPYLQEDILAGVDECISDEQDNIRGVDEYTSAHLMNRRSDIQTAANLRLTQHSPPFTPLSVKEEKNKYK